MEAQKAGKITGSCDYRYREGRVTWDYQENGRRYRQRKERRQFPAFAERQDWCSGEEITARRTREGPGPPKHHK